MIELKGGEPMTSADLADTINAEGRYRKQDGSAVTSPQVGARVSNYPQLFDRDDGGRVRLRRPGRG